MHIMEQLDQTEIDRLIPLATQVLAKHSIQGTPSELIQAAHRSVLSDIANLVREHRKYDPSVPPPEHDSAESVLQWWLGIDDLKNFFAR